jgi:hypothetical protein
MGTRALLGVFGCALLCGSIELARCPQLVAFVSYQNRNSDQASEKLTAQANPRRASAKLLDASYNAPRSAAARQASVRFRPAKPDAILPTNRPAQLVNAQTSERLADATQELDVVSKMPSYKPAPRSPRPVFRKVEMPNSQTAPTEQQQWVVITTWEQIQTPNQNTGPTANRLIADYEIGATEDAPTNSNPTNNTAAMANGTVHSQSQPANQITITRLILKIYPAASFSNQPTFVPMHNGWFVIQL